MAKKELRFNAAVQIDDEFLMATSTNFNGLFKVCIATGACTYLGSFEDESKLGGPKFFEGCKCGDKIIWSPQMAGKIGIYDMGTQKLFSVDLPIVEGKKYRTADVVAFDKYAYFTSWSGIYLVELNMLSYETKVYITEQDSSNSFRRSCLVGTKLYTAAVNGSEFVEWDLITKECVIRQIPNQFRGTFSTAYSAGKIWLAPRYYGDDAFFWDVEQQCFGTIDIYEKMNLSKEKKDDVTYLYTFVTSGKIHFIAEKNISSICIDEASNELELSDIFIKNDDEKMGVYYVTDNSVCVGNVKETGSYYNSPLKIFLYNGTNERTKTDYLWHIESSQTDYQSLRTYLISTIMLESKNLSLENYIWLTESIL